jgi:hypothetical protein
MYTLLSSRQSQADIRVLLVNAKFNPLVDQKFFFSFSLKVFENVLLHEKITH